MAAAAAGCLQRRAAYRFTDILLGLTAATTGQQAAEPAGPHRNSSIGNSNRYNIVYNTEQYITISNNTNNINNINKIIV